MGDEARRAGSFGGLEVAAFESRRAKETAALISNYGGIPRVGPSMREIPLEENVAAFDFAEKLLGGKLDGVIFMTGVGTRTLLETLATRYPVSEIVRGLSKVTIIARGPKPVAVLREFQVPVTIMVPEPNTWREILQELDENPRGFTLDGSRVAIQEYGVPNEKLIQELTGRGAEVLRVPVYRWALPEDLGPLLEALRAILEGRARVVLFTNAAQVEHVLRVASEKGFKERLFEKLRSSVVCSVGPTCSEALVANGITVDLEPEHPKMGNLVLEAAERASALLREKSGERGGAPLRGNPGLTTREAGPSSGSPGSVKVVPPRETRVPSPAPWRESRFMKACRLEPADATPVWLMRQAGRYMKEYRELRARVPFLELCKNPDLVAELTVTAARKIGADAAIIFASFLFDAIRKTRAELPGETPLIGFGAAPCTLASYIIEGGASKNFVHTKTLMYRDAGAWRALMEHLVRGLTGYINGQIAAGVQAVQVFDTWVGCLGPADYREYVQPYTRALICGISPGVPVIHFGT
ncbi:MAG: uroporphyrinogen decarboxylase, partial [Acidobacteria bacterium]